MQGEGIEWGSGWGKARIEGDEVDKTKAKEYKKNEKQK